VRVWSCSRQQERLFHSHTSFVTSVAFSLDGKYVASGSLDHTVRVWSLSTAQTRNVIEIGHTSQITSVGFTRDGKHIISASPYDSIRVWSIFGEHQQVFNVSGPADVSKDGQHIAFLTDCTLLIRSVFDGRSFHRLFSDLSGVHSVKFSDDGQWIRSKFLRGNDIIRSIHTGKEAESNTIAFNEHKNDVDNGWYDLANQLIWLPSYLHGGVWKNRDLVVFGAKSGAMVICQVNKIRLDSHPIKIPPSPFVILASSASSFSDFT